MKKKDFLLPVVLASLCLVLSSVTDIMPHAWEAEPSDKETHAPADRNGEGVESSFGNATETERTGRRLSTGPRDFRDLNASRAAQLRAQNELTYAVGPQPADVVAGDFNRDGHPDLAVAIAGSQSIQILFNRGEPTPRGAPRYATKTVHHMQGIPTSLQAADLDGECGDDLVVTNRDQHTIEVLLNDGQGSFSATKSYAVGREPSHVTVSDLDQDGLIDLVVASWLDGSVSVLMNMGQGVFDDATTYRSGETAGRVAIADVDHDNAPDLAVLDTLNRSVSILRNRGDGQFTAAEVYGYGQAGTSIAFGDLDLDGNIDIATDGLMQFLINNGDGTFTQVSQLSMLKDGPIVLADFDGDDSLDLAFALYGAVFMFLNDRQGTLGPSKEYPVGRIAALPSQHTSGMRACDVDGDGDLDIVLTDDAENTVSLLLNKGDGRFLANGHIIFSAPSPILYLHADDIPPERARRHYTGWD